MCSFCDGLRPATSTEEMVKVRLKLPMHQPLVLLRKQQESFTYSDSCATPGGCYVCYEPHRVRFNLPCIGPLSRLIFLLTPQSAFFNDRDSVLSVSDLEWPPLAKKWKKFGLSCRITNHRCSYGKNKNQLFIRTFRHTQGSCYLCN